MPVLTLVYGLPIQEAVGVSLIGIIATSTGAASYYVQQGLSNIRLGMVLETATTIGSIIGATLAVYAEEELLALAFAMVLTYSSVYMIRRPERLACPNGGRTGAITGSYMDPVEDCEVEYGVRNLKGGMLASAFAGSMSGMLGLGGGSIKVPVMNILMGVPIRAATATSNFMIGVTALAGAIIYYANDLISPVIAATVAIGVFFGSVSGSRVAMNMRRGAIKRYFALLLLFISALMVLEAVGVLA